MVVCDPQPVQPWTRDREEERRFRRILTAVLACFVAAGYLVTSWTLPPVAIQVWERELPPRIARLVTERLKPAPPPATTGSPAVPEVVATAASPTETADTPVDVPAPAPAPGAVKREEPAGDKVAEAGVLALSERLAKLRSSSPQTVTAQRESPAVASPGRGQPSRPSRLTEDVTGGSAGDGVGEVDASRVLGAASLPGKQETNLHLSGTGGAGQMSATGQARDGVASGRSQEEIQEILDRNKRAIYALYNRELRVDPALRGKVVLAITITPSGKVSSCRVVDSELDSASLEEKLVLLIEQIDFGARPGVPSVTTRVPIEFFPA
jgi:protein TonB